MGPSNRFWGALWAAIGGAALAGSVWYLRHVSPVLPASERHETTSSDDSTDLNQFLEILPWLGILIGTFGVYSGLVRLLFGAASDAVDADEGKNVGAKYAYWIGFVVVFAGVVLAGIFLLHLKLLSLNRDDYTKP